MTMKTLSDTELGITKKSFAAMYRCENGKINLDYSLSENRGILKHRDSKEEHKINNIKTVSFLTKSLQRYISRNKSYDTFNESTDGRKYGSYAEKARNFFKMFPKKSTIDEEEDSIPMDEDLGKGFLLVVLTDVLFSLAVIAAQMTSSIQAVYDLNILRLCLQMALSLVLAYIWGAPVFVKCGHAVLCIAIVLFNCVFQAMYFRSTAYLAVGDMVGLSVGIIIILAALVDGCFRQLTWATVVSTLVCCPGIILLIQPWNAGMDILVPVISPCRLIVEKVYLHHLSSWHGYNITDVTISTDISLINDTLTNMPSVTKPTGISPVQEFFIFLNPVIGYIMTTVAAVSFVINAKISKYLVSMYHPLSISCWVSSLMFVIALVTSFDTNTFSFPAVVNYFSKGWLCTFFKLVFIIGAASYQITFQCSLSYLQVSQAAVGEALSLVILFLCQVTFLTEVHPTTNTCIKAIGLCFTFFGAIIAPMIKIYRRYLKSHSINFMS